MSSDGTMIVLTYDQVLDGQNELATAAFTVKVDGQPVQVSTVTVRGRRVELGLASAVTDLQTVTVAPTPIRPPTVTRTRFRTARAMTRTA